ncbi:MAG: hypothetical protein M3A44_07930 [Gammaproteobacteria bacterium]
MNMKSLEASRHYWQQHVAAWRCSGLKQIDYCRQHGLVPKQLRYRIAKDRRNDVCVSGTDAVTLVPVQIEEVNGAGLVLQNAGGGSSRCRPVFRQAGWQPCCGACHDCAAAYDLGGGRADGHAGGHRWSVAAGAAGAGQGPLRWLGLCVS